MTANGNAGDLAIVGGYRTPFTKAGTELKDAQAADLATHVFREVLDRTGVDPDDIDEVILGCAGAGPHEANPARVAALRAGLPQRVPAVTVMRNCASGMESLLAANMRLRAGDGEVFLVGVHISPYAQAARENPEPRRERKLLLHRAEIARLKGKVAERGLTLVPLKLYFKNGRAKVELGLVRGRRRYDKREAIRRRETEREVQRTLRGRGRSRS